MEHIHAVVLAAGQSRRFQSPYTKLIAPICGKPMISYVIDTLLYIHMPTTLVLGYQSEYIREIMPHHPLVSHTYQAQQRGTGDALMCGYQTCHAKHVLVLNGDTPLITSNCIQSLIDHHTQHEASITFVTADNTPDTRAYGKVIQDNNHIEVVEARDAQYPHHTYTRVNAGIYICNTSFLDHAIPELSSYNAGGEVYITDLIAYASSRNYAVATIHEDINTVRGVNTLSELHDAETCQHTTIMQQLFDNGVYCPAPHMTRVDSTCTIAPYTRINSGAVITGNTYIGSHCQIGSHVVIENSTISDNVRIEPYSHIVDTTIERDAHIGPFARLKKHTHIRTGSSIGNFVETSEATIGPHAKAKHLSYIGNAHIDTQVNIGAGTILCNYDGYGKYNTHINAHAFIGSNTTLVAPITIGSHAIVGAGSVISKDIPENALAIARERETIKENYATHLRHKLYYYAHAQRPENHDKEGEKV